MALRLSPRLALSALCLVCLLTAGCGKKRAPASFSGKVFYDGKTVEQGAVSFHLNAEKGEQAVRVSAKIENGQVNIGEDKGLVEGTYQVDVRGYREARSPQQVFEQLEGETKKPVAVESYIPEEASTDLTIEIQAGSNSREIKLNRPAE